MYTRCPACHTVHPVNASLLAQGGGKYRCGKCNKSANALESLFDEWPEPGDKPPGAGSDTKEALEELILQAVVEAHFAYMAGQGPHTLSAGLRAKQRSLQRRQWWQRGRQLF